MLPEKKDLEIKYLARLFDNMSECYKLFWFKAIVEVIIEGKQEATYDDLINHMILDTWYMVTEYKLNLGPNDTLEKIVNYIREITDFHSNEKRDTILAFLEATEDVNIKRMKRTLTHNVPYRLQAPFMEQIKGTKEWNVSEPRLAEKINREDHLIYYFIEIKGLNSSIRIDESWCDYINENQAIIKGWINNNVIEYLQRRNPNVPGIVNKLEAPTERKLSKVIKYWKMVCEVTPVYDIYGEKLLSSKDISIDHFIPWSYVTNDELWNLSPTTRSINSSKSNNLPEWKIYFPRLSIIEYNAYITAQKSEKIKQIFDSCTKDHINNDEVRYQLYNNTITQNEFTVKLEEIMLPIYQSAHNNGFRSWEYSEQK